MKKAKLPLPVLVLISATLFLFSSSFGEWVARSSASSTPARKAAERQDAAIVYVRAMSWIAQLISQPSAHSETDADCAHTDGASQVARHETPAPNVQLCAMTKFIRPPKSLCKTWQFRIESSPHSLARLVFEQRTTDN